MTNDEKSSWSDLEVTARLVLRHTNREPRVSILFSALGETGTRLAV